MQFVVGRVDAGTATLISTGRHLRAVHLPAALLPTSAGEGAMVSVVLHREESAERQRWEAMEALQERLLRDFGESIELGELSVWATHRFVRLRWAPVQIEPHVTNMRWDLALSDDLPQYIVRGDKREAIIEGVAPSRAFDVELVLSCSAGVFHSPSAHVRVPAATDFSCIVAVLSLFDGEDQERLESQLRALGAHVAPDVSDDITHLVCRAPAGKRYEWALAHPRVRIVTAAWIERCIATGVLQDEADHALSASAYVRST